MNVDEVFRAKYDQSYAILRDLDVNRLLDLSGYLRHFLLDGLVDIVNREYKLKMLFEIGPVRDEIMLEYRLNINGKSLSYADHPDVNPKLNRSTIRKKVGKDAFLRYKIVMVNGYSYSVRDVINVCANYCGGVHLGRELTDSDRLHALHELEKNANFGGVKGAWRSLGVIGRISIESLYPLYSRVCWG